MKKTKLFRIILLVLFSITGSIALGQNLNIPMESILNYSPTGMYNSPVLLSTSINNITINKDESKLIKNALIGTSLTDDNIVPKRCYFVNVRGGSAGIYNKDFCSKLYNTTPSNGKLYNTDNLCHTETPIGFQLELGVYKTLKSMWYKKVKVYYGYGLGFSTYDTKISINSLHAENFHNGPDLDGDYIDTIHVFSGIKEETRLTYIDLPLFIEFGNVNASKLGYYFKVGIKLSYLVSSNFSGSGTDSTSGHYDADNVVLYNIPELGYYPNESLYKNKPAKNTQPVNLSAAVSCGLTIPIKETWIIKIGPTFNASIIDVGKNKSDNYYENCHYQMNANNLLSNKTSTTRTYFIGLEIGILKKLSSY